MPIPDVGDDELAKMEPEQAARCACPRCPSFEPGDRSPLFCWPTIGRSNVITEQRG